MPNVYFEIPKYDLSGEDSALFIGRGEVLEKLVNRILPTGKKGEKYKGCYLVSGYRGMGKTQLVNKAIGEVKRRRKKGVLYVPISLSQQSLDEHQVLRQLFVEFSTAVECNQYRVRKFSLIILRFLSIAASLLSSLIFMGLLMDVSNLKKILSSSGTLPLIIFIILSILLIGVILKILAYPYRMFIRFERQKRAIQNRLYSKLDQSESTSGGILKGLSSGSSLIGSLVSQVNSSGEDIRMSFEKISPKELEIEFKALLIAYSGLNFARPVLFVVDELDKLEPEYVGGDQDFFSLGKTRTSSRKEELVKILASLKSFMHTSLSKFVFIGGAELYDASLADIADRESFYSSIFHEVIYVDSFFKEHEGKKIGLTQMAESYLSNIVIGQRKKASEDHGMPLVYERINSGISDVNVRVYLYVLLYNFVVYITYRSNGSPKKIRELLEYQISSNGLQSFKEGDLVFYSDFTKFSKVVSVAEKQASKSKSFLRISYGSQYKIGLLSMLFMPYYIGKEKYLKTTNDRNLYLTAFLMDHLLKFHRSAFSWKQIELAPDVIMGSRGPNLRDTLTGIIDYLCVRHVRLTSNAMFQYKFRSRTAMELKFISKISDESAAAYNFTFDESYHLKAFFKRKLKQKMAVYSEGAYSNGDTDYIHSIAYLNSTIADIHYYDEEYEPAIRYYLDSIQRLRDVQKKYPNSISQHQQMLFVRNRLLLSLCMEKSEKYDSTYSMLREITLDLVKPRLGQLGFGFGWEDPYSRMQLFLRPFLSLLLIIEKDRSDGITVDNLKRNIEEYSSMIQVNRLFPMGEKYDPKYLFREFSMRTDADHQRIQTLLVDYYQNVGSILYLKNNIYRSLFRWGARGIWKDVLFFKDYESYIPKNSKDNYVSLRLVKSQLIAFWNGDLGQKYYQPSFIAFFYYVISLNHALMPFEENVLENRDPRISLLELLRQLSPYGQFSHILSGQQGATVANLCSKISDTILASCVHIRLSQSVNLEDLLTNNFNSFKQFASSLRLIDLYSLDGVVYFTLLSHSFFAKSGLAYDALFQLKKLLYICRAHKHALDSVDLVNVSEYAIDYAANSGLSFDNKINSLYRETFNSTDLFSSIIHTESNDVFEIKLLVIGVSGSLYPNFTLQLATRVPSIKNIYQRIQFLRYSIIARIDGSSSTISEHQSIESDFIILVNTIRGYGFSYIMSYTYFASLLQRMYFYQRSVIHDSKFELEPETLRLESIEYYRKAIRLHSEGKEYKIAIRDMFMLDDDLNDSLTHFSAALERSLINCGFVERQIVKLGGTL